jgi:hypothetical protein
MNRKRMQTRITRNTNPETKFCWLSFNPVQEGRRSLVSGFPEVPLPPDQARTGYSNEETEARVEQVSKDFVVGWMIHTAILNPELTKSVRTLTIPKEHIKTFSFLSQHKCDQALLLDRLVLAYRLPELVPKLSVTKLRTLARDVDDVLKRMRSIVPSHVFVVATPDEKDPKRGLLEEQATGGDLHVWPSMIADLTNKIAGYQELAYLCANKVVPRRDFVERIAKLLPVAYVEQRTGQPYFRKVCDLLEWVGRELGELKDGEYVNENKLGQHFRAAKQENASTMEWLRQGIWQLEQNRNRAQPCRPTNDLR